MGFVFWAKSWHKKNEEVVIFFLWFLSIPEYSTSAGWIEYKPQLIIFPFPIANNNNSNMTNNNNNISNMSNTPSKKNSKTKNEENCSTGGPLVTYETSGEGKFFFVSPYFYTKVVARSS